MARKSTKGMGDRIRDAREARGFSASEFARLTGVTPTAVSNWENNGRQPRPNARAAICRVLGVTEGHILYGEKETKIQPLGASRRNVDSILEEARDEIAALLGTPPGRVTVDMYFSKDW